jgi:hypothetical protein
LPAADDVADLHPDKVAATQFAVDGKVEQRAIAQAASFIQIKSDFLYLFRLERALGANSPSRVPDLALSGSRFNFRHLHDHSPVTTMVATRMSVGLMIENAAAPIDQTLSLLVTELIVWFRRKPPVHYRDRATTFLVTGDGRFTADFRATGRTPAIS